MFEFSKCRKISIKTLHVWLYTNLFLSAKEGLLLEGKQDDVRVVMAMRYKTVTFTVLNKDINRT